MESTVNKSLPRRLRKFVVLLCLLLLFVFAFLPLLTNSIGILGRMAAYLDDYGIDPTRYYYTDVEQVKEAEQYLESVLEDGK